MGTWKAKKRAQSKERFHGRIRARIDSVTYFSYVTICGKIARELTRGLTVYVAERTKNSIAFLTKPQLVQVVKLR